MADQGVLTEYCNVKSIKPKSVASRPDFQKFYADQSSYTPGSTIRIKIPMGGNRLLMPEDSFITFDIKNTCADDITIDGHPHAVFERVTVSHGGNQLEDIQFANVLHHNLYNIQRTHEGRLSDAPASGMVQSYTVTTKNRTFADPAAVVIALATDAGISSIISAPIWSGASIATTATSSFGCQILSGILGSLSQRAIPTFGLTQTDLYLDLTLAPAIQCLISTNTAPSYQVSNVIYHAKTTQLAESLVDEFQQFTGGKYFLQSTSWRNERKTISVGSTMIEEPLAANFNSLRNILFSFRDSANLPVETAHTISSKTNADMTQYNLTINGTSFPGQPIGGGVSFLSSLPQYALELRRSFDGLSNILYNSAVLSRAKYVAPDDTSRANESVFGMDLDRLNQSEKIISGISSYGDSIRFSARLGTAVAANPLIMDISTHYDHSVVCENGLGVAVY